MTMMARVRNFFGTQDMTVGKPMTGLLKFSIPLLIGNLAQQLYSTVDSIVVSKYIGLSALASVGAAGPILNLLLVLFMGISTGASILSAQYYGAKDRPALNRVVGSSIFLIIVSGVLMTLIGYFASPLLISLVEPEPEVLAEFPNVMKDATAYLQIIFIGILGGGLYNIISGVLRGLGDSVYPLIFLVISTLINIALDILFVSQFDMGVAGVAWATIIAQAISGVLCLVRLCRMRNVCDVRIRHIVNPNKSLTIKLCMLGLPAGITQAIFSMSAIVVSKLTNSIGVAMMAANTAIMRVDGYAMMPNFTFGTAATTYVGQNIGARKGDRLKTGRSALLRLALISSCILVGCILVFGELLLGLFIDDPNPQKVEEALALAKQGLQTLALGYICFSVTQVLQGAMRGAGETFVPMVISIVTTVIVRMPLAYLLAALTKSEEWPNGAPESIFLSLLISWVLGMVLSIIAYRLKWWRKKLPEELRHSL